MINEGPTTITQYINESVIYNLMNQTIMGISVDNNYIKVYMTEDVNNQSTLVHGYTNRKGSYKCCFIWSTFILSFVDFFEKEQL